MAEYTVVNSSDLGNRWDAGYHIIFAQLRARVARLQATVSADEARSRLADIPLQDLKPLLVLARGQTRSEAKSIDRKTADAILAEYPHLALAVMQTSVGPVIGRIRSEIAKNEAALDALLELEKDAAKDDDGPEAPKP